MQVMVRLPETLGERFRAAVPARKRSVFIAELLNKALPVETDPLYQLALAVENDDALNADMDAWDVTAGDGFEDGGHDETR